MRVWKLVHTLKSTREDGLNIFRVDCKVLVLTKQFEFHIWAEFIEALCLGGQDSLGRDTVILFLQEVRIRGVSTYFA
jgi:hypothetical protein